MSKTILEAKGLRYSLGDRLLLDAGRLAVCEDERIGLIGENGAGKTTLLRLLAGETEADEGTVRRSGSLAFIHQQGKEEGEADEQMRALFRAKEQRKGLSGGEKGIVPGRGVVEKDHVFLSGVESGPVFRIDDRAAGEHGAGFVGVQSFLQLAPGH